MAEPANLHPIDQLETHVVEVWKRMIAKGEPEAIPVEAEHALAVMSIAVSLKRIADLLDGTTLGIGMHETIFSPMSVQNCEVRIQS